MKTEDEMGAGHSKEEQARLKAAIQKLSKVKLLYIDKIFNELFYHTDEGESLIMKPTWLTEIHLQANLVCPIFLVNVYLLPLTEIRMEQLTLKDFSVECTLFAWTC